MIKKADIFLILGLAVAGLAVWLLLLFPGGDETTVVITVDGAVYGRYSLDEDRTVILDDGDDHNTVVIRDRTVQMAEANCRGGDCKRQGVIRKNGQSIICLPHRIVVRITGGTSPDIDVIVS